MTQKKPDWAVGDSVFLYSKDDCPREELLSLARDVLHQHEQKATVPALPPPKHDFIGWLVGRALVLCSACVVVGLLMMVW